MVVQGWDGCYLRNAHDRREADYAQAAATFVFMVQMEMLPNTHDAWQDFLSGYLPGIQWLVFSAS